MKNFIIHLPSVPASLESATVLQEKLEDLGADVSLFEGTRGDDAMRLCFDEGRLPYNKTLKGQEISAEELKKKAQSEAGVKGCFYSHYNLWNKCIELNEPIIIWEDDIIIERAFIPVEWEEILIVALGHPMKSPRHMHLLTDPEGDPAAIPYKSPSMPGCCGYAIKPSAAQKLVDVYKNTYRPADNAINRSIVKIEIHNYIMGIAQVDGKKSLTKASWLPKKKKKTSKILKRNSQ